MSLCALEEPNSTPSGTHHRRPPAGAQQAQEQGDEQQLGLLGLDDLQQVLGRRLIIQRSGEGRVGEDQRIGAGILVMLLGQAVAVGDVRVLHPVQGHVHGADAQHGRVKVKAVEHAVVEMGALSVVDQHPGVVVAQVFPGGHEEAAGARGGVADDVLRGRGHQVDHQRDDVARRAELAVLPGAGDLAEHVFEHVALGVPVVHRDVVEQRHDLGQQVGVGEAEARILHVDAVAGAFLAQGAQERKDVFIHDLHHLARFEVLEAGPAKVVIGAFVGVEALGENAAIKRAAQRLGLVFFEGVEVVEALDEQQVGDLLDDRERVGDATRPESVPDLVHLIADLSRQHAVPPCVSIALAWLLTGVWVAGNGRRKKLGAVVLVRGLSSRARVAANHGDPAASNTR
jgi:hypothetical protein